jgi:transposase
MTNPSITAAGIDTGKMTLDVALSASAERLQLSNDPPGHRKLAAWLRRHRVDRVGIEASGGYERAVVAHLRAEGVVVMVFQPRQVRAYASFRLQRAKTDTIDAGLIAACAAALGAVRAAPDPRLQALAGPLTLIEQIEEDIARWKTRAEAAAGAAEQRFIERQITRFKAARGLALKRLAQAVRAHADLATKLALLISIPGLGERTALALLLRLPELGCLSREQIAALAGLAPFPDDSGQRTGERHVAGGRARVRKSLYAAALPAAFQWNQRLVALYQRLTAKGKPHKLALVACARKLLIFANTVLARGTPWSQTAPAR